MNRWRVPERLAYKSQAAVAQRRGAERKTEDAEGNGECGRGGERERERERERVNRQR